MWDCELCPADAVNHCNGCGFDYCLKHMDDDDNWCHRCYDIYADQ